MLKKAYDYAIAIVRKNLRRSAKYSLNGFLGFGIVELITLIGITYLDLSHILLIDSAAFVSGVALEFFLNEYWTTKNQGFHGSHIFGLLFRLLKFEIMNIVGTSLAVTVQFTLFKLFALYQEQESTLKCPGSSNERALYISLNSGNYYL